MANGFTLDVLNMPPNPVGETAVDQICTALANAIDTSGHPLLVSATPGMDTVLLDAIQANPPTDLMPLARVNYTPLRFSIDSNVGSPVQWEAVRIEIYILYYFGVQPSNFNILRNRHVRLLQNFLRFNLSGNTGGIDFKNNVWRWDSSQSVEVDSDIPFRYIDQTLVLSPGCSCTRIDRYIGVNNWG